MYPPHRKRRRTGFTLVELLVVIVIISILVALLVPAVVSGVRRARDAQTAAEIQTIAQSLQSFKTKFGDFPPSRVVLREDGMIADARTLRYMRKFFPRVQFDPTKRVFGGGNAAAITWYDFNGNGLFENRAADDMVLQGHECLVFFLGGVPIPNRVDGSTQEGRYGDGTYAGMSGFYNGQMRKASNTTEMVFNPFWRESDKPTPRTRPFFEFKADRLMDMRLGQAAVVGPARRHGVPGYIDPLGTQSEARPYLYFSAYGGNAYDPDDENTGAPEDVGTNRAFGTNSNFAPSAAPNPYTSNEPVSAAGPKYVNPESYQIISAGRDRIYGVGGRYLGSGQGERLPLDGVAPADIRYRERDNITNFAGNGTLD